MKLINITGLKFNRLTAIKCTGRNKFNIFLWLFRCDCGNEKVIRKDSVMFGHTKSCGCLFIEEGRKKVKIMNSKRTNHENSYKRTAKSKNNIFSINREEFLKLILGNCFYCGIIPSREIKYKTSVFKRNGIDRIDNSKGYILSNCVSCCKDCNFKKSNVSLDIIKKVYEYLKLENNG